MKTCTLIERGQICGKKIVCKELCSKHYNRLWKWGNPYFTLYNTAGSEFDTSTVSSATPSENSSYTSSYGAVHQRLQYHYGKASEYVCSCCGQDAAHWSYDNCDPNECYEINRGRFSLDLDHYEPMCVRCHKSRDSLARRIMLAA